MHLLELRLELELPSQGRAQLVFHFFAVWCDYMMRVAIVLEKDTVHCSPVYQLLQTSSQKGEDFGLKASVCQ